MLLYVDGFKHKLVDIQAIHNCLWGDEGGSGLGSILKGMAAYIGELDRVSICSPGWPQALPPSASASDVLRKQACAA